VAFGTRCGPELRDHPDCRRQPRGWTAMTWRGVAVSKKSKNCYLLAELSLLLFATPWNDGRQRSPNRVPLPVNCLAFLLRRWRLRD